MHTRTYSWAEVRILCGHFRGALVLAAPPEWRPPCPDAPPAYLGPAHIWAPNDHGVACPYQLAPVLICDAWGSPAAPPAG